MQTIGSSCSQFTGYVASAREGSRSVCVTIEASIGSGNGAQWAHPMKTKLVRMGSVLETGTLLAGFGFRRLPSWPSTMSPCMPMRAVESKWRAVRSWEVHHRAIDREASFECRQVTAGTIRLRGEDVVVAGTQPRGCLRRSTRRLAAISLCAGARLALGRAEMRSRRVRGAGCDPGCGAGVTGCRYGCRRVESDGETFGAIK